MILPKTTFKKLFIRFTPLFVALLFVLIFASCTESKKANAPSDPVTVAPSFTLKSLDGNDVSLSDYQNKVVVLFFLGNNCPSCKAVAPSIQSDLVTPFASNSDYVLLGLDQWNGNAASLETFRTSTGVSFPLLLNASNVASDYKTTYDRIVVIDKQGKIAFSGKQSAVSDLSAAKTKVTELLTVVEPPKGDAPDFKLKSLDGSDVSLSDYKNKVVVLFFFGNNCPSCKAAAPSVQSNLVTPFASDADYVLLGLDQWNGNSSSVQAFKTFTGVSFPLLLSASGVAADYKITYDRLLVIDKSGNIAFKGTQSASADISNVKTKVNELLGK